MAGAGASRRRDVRRGRRGQSPRLADKDVTQTSSTRRQRRLPPSLPQSPPSLPPSLPLCPSLSLSLPPFPPSLSLSLSPLSPLSLFPSPLSPVPLPLSESPLPGPRASPISRPSIWRPPGRSDSEGRPGLQRPGRAGEVSAKGYSKKIPARYGGTAVRGALHTRRRRGWPSRGPLKLPETGPQRACPLSGACGGGVRAFSRILADFPLRGERARTHRGRKAPHVTCSTPGQGH